MSISRRTRKIPRTTDSARVEDQTDSAALTRVGVPASATGRPKPSEPREATHLLHFDAMPSLAAARDPTGDAFMGQDVPGRPRLVVPTCGQVPF
jgi:hypothetical protein